MTFRFLPLYREIDSLLTELPAVGNRIRGTGEKGYIFTKSARKLQVSNMMIDPNQEEDILDEKVAELGPTKTKEPPEIPEPEAAPPGTRHFKNPVQVLNMYRRQFSQEAVDFAVEWQKSKGERGSAPMFMRANLPGEWSGA